MHTRASSTESRAISHRQLSAPTDAKKHSLPGIVACLVKEPHYWSSTILPPNKMTALLKTHLRMAEINKGPEVGSSSYLPVRILGLYSKKQSWHKICKQAKDAQTLEHFLGIKPDGPL